MTYELVVGPVEKIVEKILHALDLDVECPPPLLRI